MLRKQLLMLGFIGSAGLMTGCGESSEPTEKTELETTEQKVSYVIGLNLANNFEEGGITIDPDALVLAMRDKRDGVEPRLTEEESNDVMRSFQEQEMDRRAQEQLAQAEAFLAQNREKEGVETTDSGLQYKVVEEGDGAQPGPTDGVVVHYRGTLIDGTEFDSSYKRNQPASFPVNGIIIGWTEALQMMKVGSKWELYIPPDLAYGPQGNHPIPPNAVLIFEVELLEIEPNEGNEDIEGDIEG